MQVELLNSAKEKILNCFSFLDQLGYEVEKSELEGHNLQIHFEGSVINKVVEFLVTNSERTNRFFMTISIVRKPYLGVNDFIDFDIYLKKNKIVFKDALVSNEINDAEIDKYIQEYSDLFKKFGIGLIITDEQFPHYFPEWT